MNGFDIGVNIACGLAANALTSLIARAWHGPKTRPQEALVKKDDGFNELVRKTVMEAVETFIDWPGPSSIDIAWAFLESQEAESILRSLYTVQLSGEPSSNETITSLQKNCFLSFSNFSGVSELQARKQSRLIFEFLLRISDQILNKAIEQGNLLAHEIKSVSRHRQTLDEFDILKKRLEFLTQSQATDVPAILEYEKTYRRQVGNRHQHIIVHDFDRNLKHKLDDLYVAPNFVFLSEQGIVEVTSRKGIRSREESLDLPTFLQKIHRTVLLGNPGGGKSTLSEKVCYDLCTQYEKRLVASRLLTPVLVILREYGEQKKKSPCSILQFIEEKTTSRYQSPPIQKAFDYLLNSERVLVIFDGLDELLETGDRLGIAGDIESFCSQYPSTPVLVTSREVGYLQAPLDTDVFSVFRLSEFNENQIGEYVAKWFRRDPDLSDEERIRKIQSFLQESSVIAELRSDPLILALLCNIYRNENYIPRNRPEVYRKCAEMLFERWDLKRSIKTPLKIEPHHMQPMLMFLAHWLYTEKNKAEGVLESQLIIKTTNYLCSKLFEERNKAESAAKEFIGHCRGRAWVFTDVGTQKDGESLYTFTHRTFLEYFTAANLVRTHETVKALAKTLLPKIAKQEWGVVPQLAFQIKDKQSEKAADQLLRMVLQEATKKNNAQHLSLLLFAAKCLSFMTPSRPVCREIASACIDFCLESVIPQTLEEGAAVGVKRKLFRESAIPVSQEILLLLVSCSDENIDPVLSQLEQKLCDAIRQKPFPINIIAGEIGLGLSSFSFNTQNRSEREKRLKTTHQTILNQQLEQFRQFAPVSLYQCVALFENDAISIQQMIDWYGYHSLFQSSDSMVSNSNYFPIVDYLSKSFIDYIWVSETPNLDQTLYSLRQLGQIFFQIRVYFPIIYYQREYDVLGGVLGQWARMISYSAGEAEVGTTKESLDSDTLFGVFLVFSPLLEDGAFFERWFFDEDDEGWDLRRTPHDLFNTLCTALYARFEKVDPQVVQAALEKCVFSPQQQEFIQRWIHREISFVGRENDSSADDKVEKDNNSGPTTS